MNVVNKMDTNSCKNDICNMALSLLREKAVLNIDDHEPATDTERLLNLWYDSSRKECIIDVKPTFALKREILVEEKDVELNYTKYHAYRIPEDCLEILGVISYANAFLNIVTNCNIYGENCIEISEENIIEGDYIYSKMDKVISLRYLYDCKKLSSKNTKFNICLSYYIAYNICSELQNNQQLLSSFLQLKEKKQSETRTYYLKQVKPYFVKKYEWRKE